ncbi:MAG: hypothetical protein R3C26_00410 [Calditrichia bacterium]
MNENEKRKPGDLHKIDSGVNKAISIERQKMAPSGTSSAAVGERWQCLSSMNVVLPFSNC